VPPPGRLESVRLMGPDGLDARSGEPLANGGVEVVRHGLREAGLRAFAGRRDQFLVAPGFENCVPGVRRPDSAHGLP
jgi:hypothetical protein